MRSTPRTPSFPPRLGAAPRRANRCLTDVAEAGRFCELDLGSARAVSLRYAFRSNDYYLGLIDPADPADPIRRLILPSEGELDGFGGLDPSDEAANTLMTGLQHKYLDTAVLLVTDECAGFCRYCFRKRLFLSRHREANKDISPALDYIRRHEEITDVLLTGGDPLTLPTPTLRSIITGVAQIPHVHVIRIGSKVPAFNPYRILGDRALHKLLAAHCSDAARIHLMCHFDHPRELTPEAIAAISLLRGLGVVCVNQCPVSRGINDDAGVLAELFQRTTDAGCPPYYVFQVRPAAGNAPFVLPLTRAFELVAEARAKVSGLAGRARFVMSHSTGKIEVVGLDDRFAYARYHRAKDPADRNRMLVLERDDEAYWFDQLRETGRRPRRCA